MEAMSGWEFHFYGDSLLCSNSIINLGQTLSALLYSFIIELIGSY